jgi:3-oxoacyl-[acyl-carrier protein] reductase
MSPSNGVRSGRVAIVTGGSRGVGQLTVRRLAGQGHAVAVNYLHDQQAAESTVDKVLAENGAAVAVRADVADELDVQRLFVETIEAFGGVDIVVHTAGRRVAAWATFLVNREAARHLRTGGAIVNLVAAPDAATSALTRVLAVELGARGITVNAVALEPGRPCAPERVADSIVYLLSDRGRGLTGRVLGPGTGTPPRWRVRRQDER